MNDDTILTFREGEGLDLDPEPPRCLRQLHTPDGHCPTGESGRGSRGRRHPLCRADRRGQGLLRGPGPQGGDRRRRAPLEDIVHGTYNNGPEDAGADQAGHRRGQQRRGRGRGQHRARCGPLRGHRKRAVHPGLLQIGLIPDGGGTWMLPKLIGLQRATALAYLGTPVGAPDAASMGMIHRAIPDANFTEEVQALAHHLAAMPTRGLALTKAAFNAGFEQGLDAQLDTEMKLQKPPHAEDYAEGVAAFLEERAGVQRTLTL